MPVELDHLSYSSISTYQLCARSWFYRYVEKVKTPTAPALVFGSAIHNTIEAVIRGDATEQPVPVAETWRLVWAKASEQEIAWDGELPQQMETEGHRLLTCPGMFGLLQHLKPLFIDHQPVIEKRVELRVPGVPIPILGFIDIIAADGIPGDFKTASRAWTDEQAEKETQPLFYLAALSQEGYALNPEYKFRHYVMVKTKTPQIQVLESKHTPAQLFWLFKSVQEVWRGIEAGVFPPCPGSWKCSEKWCEYWGLCRGKA